MEAFSVLIIDNFVCFSENQLSKTKLQYPDIDVNTKT